MWNASKFTYRFHKLYSHIKLKIYIQKFYYDRFFIYIKLKIKIE